AVMESVREDVDPGLVPWHEGAVHPDELPRGDGHHNLLYVPALHGPTWGRTRAGLLTAKTIVVQCEACNSALDQTTFGTSELLYRLRMPKVRSSYGRISAGSGPQIDEAGLPRLGRLLNVPDDVGGDRRVHREPHQRLAADGVPRHLDAGDVDVDFAEHAPHLADHPGPVGVPQEAQVPLRLHVDRVVVDADDVLLVALAEDRAAHGHRSLVRLTADDHDVDVIRALGRAGLLHPDPPLLGHQGCVHVGDRLVHHGAEESLQPRH